MKKAADTRSIGAAKSLVQAPQGARGCAQGKTHQDLPDLFLWLIALRTIARRVDRTVLQARDDSNAKLEHQYQARSDSPLATIHQNWRCVSE
ncbi:hypothetical protein [Variovorax defluvii]|uniref:hypothetical protein n=1 Tax=Variovorax defluvii TaxID=913761 RepID=UPI0031E9A6A0